MTAHHDSQEDKFWELGEHRNGLHDAVRFIRVPRRRDEQCCPATLEALAATTSKTVLPSRMHYWKSSRHEA